MAISAATGCRKSHNFVQKKKKNTKKTTKQRKFLIYLITDELFEAGPDLPHGAMHSAGSPAFRWKNLFLGRVVFTYIWQENVAKTPKVPVAPRNVNLA